MKQRNINEAVDQLVGRKRILLFKDERGYNIRGDVPSLIEQLESAVARDGSGSGSGGRTSRPPIAVGVTALLIEIATTTSNAVTERHGTHPHNIPDNLRRIAADRANLPTTDPDVTEWVDKINKWVAKARTVLGIEPKYPRGLRGIPCPNCGADSIPALDDNGETVRTPALQFAWSETGDTPEDEMPPDRTVRAVECQICGFIWWAGAQFYDLQERIQRMINDNLTHETLAEGA